MSKEAMKLAQKAIEAHNSGDWDAASELFDEALTALRKALANEALDRVSENARELGLDYGVEQDLRVFARIDAMRAKGLLKLTAALEQPAPATELREQEPVTLGYMNAGHVHEMQQGRLPYGYVYPKRGAGASVAVYTSPPAQRKPLTDEQIDALREKHSEGRGAGWRFDFKGFARAIEAKLKEKNT